MPTTIIALDRVPSALEHAAAKAIFIAAGHAAAAICEATGCSHAMRSNPQPRFSYAAVMALVLVILSAGMGVGRAAPKVTLESVCDKVGVLQTSYAPCSFTDSCALLESSLRQALIHSELPQAGEVRKRLTLQASVSPAGDLAFSVSTPELGCTIREVVRQFAATWKVAATISGDQILFSKLPAKSSAGP